MFNQQFICLCQSQAWIWVSCFQSMVVTHLNLTRGFEKLMTIWWSNTNMLSSLFLSIFLSSGITHACYESFFSSLDGFQCYSWSFEFRKCEAFCIFCDTSNPLPHFLYCSIRLTVYDFVKRLIATSEKEFQQIVEDNREKKSQTSNWTIMK